METKARKHIGYIIGTVAYEIQIESGQSCLENAGEHIQDNQNRIGKYKSGRRCFICQKRTEHGNGAGNNAHCELSADCRTVFSQELFFGKRFQLGGRKTYIHVNYSPICNANKFCLM